MMKYPVKFTMMSLMIVLSGVLMVTCSKNDGPEDNPAPGGTNSAKADTVSNHLRFFNATKKKGIAPAASAASSLKVSFKDTLFLVEDIKRPIKFLHKDTLQNVVGAYIQVQVPGSSGGLASDYYDVPEVPDMSNDDTVSVIMIGIDPTGLDLPANVDITIIPYDEKGKPIAKATKPLKIEKPGNNPSAGAAACGLVLPQGEWWEWELSYILNKPGTPPGFAFQNEPGKVFSGEGQDIDGSCCFGNSVWPQFCVGTTFHNKKLHFATYYRINFELFFFFADGTFARNTQEDAPVPLPNESNFCSGGAGKVKESIKDTYYGGNWTTTQANLPPDLQNLAALDKLELRLQGTSSTGTGYGNPGGVLHNFGCGMNELVMIQLDKEGAGKHLYKFYIRRKPGDKFWYDFQ